MAKDGNPPPSHFSLEIPQNDSFLTLYYESPTIQSATPQQITS